MAMLACRAEGGCAHDYDDADMQQARCMLCRRRGHFCCQSTAQLPVLQASCYNCGEGGHTGVECWRVRLLRPGLHLGSCTFRAVLTPPLMTCPSHALFGLL